MQDLVLQEKIIVPYSNAHLNDLFRGFLKKPDFIEGHLNNIERLTKNLCNCQYWNNEKVTWHYRYIHEFFEEKKNERDFEMGSFEDFFKSVGVYSALLPLKTLPMPDDFHKGYSADPLFGLMFPTSKHSSDYYTLMEDIFDFNIRMKEDYSLYKTFKSQLVKSMSRLKSNQVMLRQVKQNLKDFPKHLDIFEMADQYAPKDDSLKNKAYSKILDTFYKYDLKGYKTDGNFNNMFDDSLHTFYAAHCDFFVTNDDRCKYKAKKTYERLGILTKVIKSNEVDLIKRCL